MQPLCDFLNRAIDDVLGMVTGLRDLIAIEHGPGCLLWKGKAEERAGKPDHKRPHQQLLAEWGPHVDAERGQHHVDEDARRNR